MMASTLSVPCADWFTPCEKSVTTFSVVLNQSKNVATSARRDAAAAGDGVDVGSDVARARQRFGEALGMVADEGPVERVALGKMREQSAKEHAVGSRRDLQDEIGILGRCGASRIDDDDARAATRAGCAPCAGAGPDGTRPHSSRRAP